MKVTMKLFCFSYWNTWQMSTCGARSRVLWVPWNPSVPLASDGSWYGLAMWLCTIKWCKLSSREGTFDCVRRWGRQHNNWTENTIEWTNMTMPGRLGEGWVESLTWRRNSVSSVRGVMMVMVMMMVMMVHVYVALFRIIFRPLASNPWCTSSSRSSSVMPRWLFWGNHCNACGMFYHWSCSWSQCCVSLDGISF